MPWVDASVQDVPSGWSRWPAGRRQPPARAAASSAAVAQRELVAAGRVQRGQAPGPPPSEETKNCWRTTPSLVCEPVVTIVSPESTMRWMVWKTPRCGCP